jgi:hypothetical protein
LILSINISIFVINVNKIIPMNYNLPVFKSIQIEKKNGAYESYGDSSILITGDYLIVIKHNYYENDTIVYTEHNIINLSEIKSYKTK